VPLIWRKYESNANEKRKQNAGGRIVYQRPRPRHRLKLPTNGAAQLSPQNVLPSVHLPPLCRSTSHLLQGQAKDRPWCRVRALVDGANESSSSHLREVALVLLEDNLLRLLLKRMVSRPSIDPDLLPQLERTDLRELGIADPFRIYVGLCCDAIEPCFFLTVREGLTGPYQAPCRNIPCHN
jgi:hypothetical protein